MRVAVLVNSCAPFWPRTSRAVLASLRVAGVPPEAVFVAVGQSAVRGSEAVFVQGAGGEYCVTTAHVPWANMDDNALLWAATTDRLGDFEWAFYMHDTCEALPGFWDELPRALAAALAERPDLAAVKLHGPFSMCMGYYRLDALRGVAPAVAATANLDPARLMDVKREVEDRVFGVLAGAGMGVGVLPNVYAPGPAADPYGTGVPRIAEKYDTPGLLKHKANWRTFDRLDL